MTRAPAGAVHRGSTRTEAMTVAVADAVPMSIQMPEVVTLMLIAMSSGIACAEQ